MVMFCERGRVGEHGVDTFPKAGGVIDECVRRSFFRGAWCEDVGERFVLGKA